MATNSNMSYSNGAFPASGSNVFTIWPGSMNSSSELVLPIGSSVNMNNNTGILNPIGNSGDLSNMAGLVWGGNSTSGLLLDTVPGLNQRNTGLGVDWSLEEQSVLENGLLKYAGEPNIMKYIKIAADLPNKTVRDVALRCRWMTNDKGKRRKLDEYCTGKKIRDWKDKLLDSLPKANIHPTPQPKLDAHSFLMHQTNHNDHQSFEEVGGVTRQLLDENTQVFSQIATNLASFKVEENMELFCRARNNITTILNDMRNMPGIMSRMLALPVSLNEELAKSFLPTTSQEFAFATPSSVYLKQEPHC